MSEKRRDTRTGRPGRFDLALSTAGTIASGVVRLLYNVLLGNLRGATFLGNASSALSVAMFAAIVQPQAVATAATTFVPRAAGASPRHQDCDAAPAVAWYLARYLVSAAALVGIGAGATAYFVLATGPTAAVMTALVTIGYSAYIFARALQFATFRAVRAARADLVAGVVALALLVAFLTLHLDSLILLPLALGYGVAASSIWPRRDTRISPGLRAELRRFIAIGSIGALATGGFLQLSMITARVIGTSEQAGQYAAALSLATPLSMLSTAISMVVVPAMGAAVGGSDDARFRHLVDEAVRGVSAVSLAGFGLVAGLSSIIVPLLYRDGFEDAAPVLAILAVAMLTMTATMPLMNALIVRSPRGVRTTTVISVIATVLGVVVWAAFGPRYGITAVAFGVLAGNVTALASMGVLVARAERFDWRGLALRHGVVLVATAALAIHGAATNEGIILTLGMTLAVLALWSVLVAMPDRAAILGLLGLRARGSSHAA
ncbi:lipopolysaccharide biosynthesis protein [Xylanimonas protaetiae]|uniref:Lipopolysaccharide biosynthesis protein n=1 Tax=Xylanimonas protaetiae TaxID=2509457 RepID=A0A4P6EZN8_9MICO|nr:lipopolysaccharide biosynthesis protein [Xylanimonas protaetiae]QAY68920.1 lipopolysaccharide biosynthesis protein [Xylanimonas protaetiae]